MLTNRKRAFIDHYLSTRNAAESARRAGYSVKTANRIGSRLLSDVDVKSAIEAGLELDRGRLTQETFVQLAMKDYESVEVDSNNRPRFLHLAGQGAGIVGSGTSERPNQTLNITINAKDTKELPSGEVWDKLRGLLELGQ